MEEQPWAAGKKTAISPGMPKATTMTAAATAARSKTQRRSDVKKSGASKKRNKML